MNLKCLINNLFTRCAYLSFAGCSFHLFVLCRHFALLISCDKFPSMKDYFDHIIQSSAAITRFLGSKKSIAL